MSFSAMFESCFPLFCDLVMQLSGSFLTALCVSAVGADLWADSEVVIFDKFNHAVLN